MPALNRGQIKPDQGFLVDLATRSIAHMVPTGNRWFRPLAFREDQELGKHLRAWGKVLGGLLYETISAQYNIFLNKNGSDLDVLGTSLGFTRKLGESDDDYANRIAAELVAERVTPNALVKLITVLSKGTVNGSIFEPWRKVKIRGDASPRSGGGRRADMTFWRGGTFELVTDGYIPNLAEAINRSRAAGIAAYIALSMEALVDVNDDPLAQLREGEKCTYVAAENSFIFEDWQSLAVDPDQVILELPYSLEIMADAGAVLSACSNFPFGNLSRNCLLGVDMVASSASGSPVYETVYHEPFPLSEPTSLQPAPLIVYEGDPEWPAFFDDPGLIV